MTCCGKSTKYFKRKIYIILRICGIGYVLSNYDYLFINIEIFENLCIKKIGVKLRCHDYMLRFVSIKILEYLCVKNMVEFNVTLLHVEVTQINETY
jgi:hypothetical protein